MKKILSITALLFFLVSISGIAQAVEVNPYTAGYIEGYLINLTAGEPDAEDIGGKAEIESYSGQHYYLDINPRASFSIDRIPVTRQDFQSGMEVYAAIQGKQIISIEAYSTTCMGYITPGSRVRKGIIREIDRSQIQIYQSNGKQAAYYTTPATITQRKGKNVSLGTLYEGDRVLLYFDDIHTDIVTRMQVEGDSIVVKDLYKGDLAVVDEIENMIGLENVEVFRNGKWQPSEALSNLPLISQHPLYAGGQIVPLNNLKYYRGKTVYLASKNILGRESIAQMVIKNQYESGFSDKIDDINWYTEALEMKNNRNFAFNNGSIIIKNGRLQDKYALNAGADAYILADGRGSSRFASIIYIYNEDINNSNIGQNYIYTGRIDQVFEDAVTLNKFFILNQHEWEAFDEEKDLYYDNDTRIYDMVTEKLITPKEFIAGDYTEDWYAYILADGDRIAAITLQKTMDSLLRQRISNGMIASIEDNSLAGWKITLRDGKDWSNRRDQWMPKSSNLNISIAKAMILKNGTMITPEELKTGDRLYIVRDDFKAKVIIVK